MDTIRYLDPRYTCALNVEVDMSNRLSVSKPRKRGPCIYGRIHGAHDGHKYTVDACPDCAIITIGGDKAWLGAYIQVKDKWIWHNLVPEEFSR